MRVERTSNAVDKTVSGQPRRVESRGAAVLNNSLQESSSPRGRVAALHAAASQEPELEGDTSSLDPDSLRKRFKVLSGPGEAELLLEQLASHENLLETDNNIPALTTLQLHSTEALVLALSNLILEDKLGDNPRKVAYDLVELFPLQDIPPAEKAHKRLSIKQSACDLLEASREMGSQISLGGETLFNLNETKAEANLAENNIMTTLIQHLNDSSQERRIRNIALDFNKRIIDDNEKSLYLKAFLEQAMSLISKAASDSTLINQQTKAQRLAQNPEEEKKITFTPVGMTEMIKALNLFNDQYAREHNLELGEGKY